MLNSVIFVYIYRKRMEKQQRGKVPMLAWQLGTPVHIPTVTGRAHQQLLGGCSGSCHLVWVQRGETQQ